MRVPLRTTVRTHHHDGRAEILDEMPSRTRDGEEVHIGADVAEHLERRVMLKQEVHLNGDAADVLEHVGELHVLGVGAEAVESGAESASHRAISGHSL